MFKFPTESDMNLRSARSLRQISAFSRGPRAATARAGFTLVEVIIAIAIALLLIVGISEVFAIAQRTIGAGTTVQSSIMADRGIQSTFADDFRSMANGTDSPGLVITSSSINAWRSQTDMKEDRDGNVSTYNDLVGSGSLPTPAAPTSVDYRVHRDDRLGFFVRGRYVRQTAQGANLTSPTTSDEAFIWIGHVAVPNNQTVTNWTGAAATIGYRQPGARNGTGVNANENNFYASDWILGREVILLSPNPIESQFWRGINPKFPDPLSLFTAVSPDGSQLASSRYDLAMTSISMYRIVSSQTGTRWWEGVSGLQVSPSGSNIISDVRYIANPFVRKPTPAVAASPVNAAQWMSAASAQTYPVFVRGCTQFIVEFAGDYLKQNPITGLVNGPGQDGQVDYVVENPTAPVAQQIRHIRWYGFPRDTNNDGLIDPKRDGTQDVVPVGQVPGSGGPMPFERSGTFPLPQNVQFSQATDQLPPRSNAYVCAWGPDTDGVIPRPRMIRITLAIDDPAGHLSNEQVYEYVFNLP
jgi:prepilin-type N-terminal cleavage/methylation domain-containing protein